MPNAIEQFPVPLIFKKILKDEMSGKLIVTHPDFTKEFHFQEGRLAYAGTTLEHERIGEILLASGKIDISQMRMALGIRQNVPTKIGEILSKLADLSMREIYQALIIQAKNIAISTFPLKQGEWRFIMKQPDIKNPQNLNIKVSEIIHAGCQLLDDFSYFKHRFFYRSPVTTELPDYCRKFLIPEEINFHNELGQHFNTSIKQIIEELHIPATIFWTTIALLYYLNLVDFVEFTVDNEDQNQKLEEINELHQKIKSGEADYYELLGTDKIESMQQLDRIFADSSEKYDPTSLDIAPDSTAMMRAQNVYSEIQKAYQQVKHNFENKNDETAPPNIDAKSNEKEEEIDNPEKIIQNIHKKNARELYTRANHFYNHKKYFEAATLLQEAISIDDSRANYFYLLGLCQSQMPSTKKMAERSLKKAAQIESWNADPLFALGQLYRSEKLVRKAKEYFEKALELNMEHTLAGKAMDELGHLYGNKGKKSAFSLFGKKN